MAEVSKIGKLQWVIMSVAVYPSTQLAICSSLYLSSFLGVFLFIHLSNYLSLWHISHYPSGSLSILFVSLWISPNLCVSLFFLSPSFSLPPSLSLDLSVCLPGCLPACLPGCRTIGWQLYNSARLPSKAWFQTKWYCETSSKTAYSWHQQQSYSVKIAQLVILGIWKT